MNVNTAGKMKCPMIPTMRSSLSDLSYELKDVYYAHPTECHMFIECDKDNMTILECPNQTHFSSMYQSCVHPSISNCKKDSGPDFVLSQNPIFKDETENQQPISLDNDLTTDIIGQNSDPNSAVSASTQATSSTTFTESKPDPSRLLLSLKDSFTTRASADLKTGKNSI